MPSDVKSSLCLWQGELKRENIMLIIKSRKKVKTVQENIGISFRMKYTSCVNSVLHSQKL